MAVVFMMVLAMDSCCKERKILRYSIGQRDGGRYALNAENGEEA
jgi:hypothetical protein